MAPYKKLFSPAATLLLSIFLTLGLPNTSFARPLRGGSDAGGGGSGVACFAQKADADLASRAFNEGKAFPKELLRKITTLELLDYCENRSNPYFSLEASTAKTGQTYLEGILSSQLQDFAPAFTARIREALLRVGLQNSNTVDMTGDLESIHDIGISSCHLPPEYGFCAPVQIAVRFASLQAGRIPAHVELDYNLFRRLGLERGVLNINKQVLNQSMLRLHEALYLIGFGLGQKTSEKVRLMTAKILSVDFYTDLLELALGLNRIFLTQHPTMPSILVPMKRTVITGTIFANGFSSFSLVDRGEISPLQMRLMTGLNNFLAATKARGLQANGLKLVSSDVDAEAFMGYSYVALNRGNIDDVYDLIDPTLDDKAQVLAVKKVCNVLIAKEFSEPARVQRNLPAEVQAIFQGAKRFCNPYL